MDDNLRTDLDDLDDVPDNPSTAPTLGDVINRRFSRRSVLQGALGVVAAGALLPLSRAVGARQADAVPAFVFDEISHGVDGTHHVAPGYRADVLIRWGDPVLDAAAPFDPLHQDSASQRAQFGFNNDYIAYIPLPHGSNASEHGLLCVNHEYTDARMMFPGEMRGAGRVSRQRVDTEMAAHGASVVEIEKRDGRWQVLTGSRYARRISALDSVMRLSGPAAGSARLQTGEDPQGRRVVGTINNCAGGVTPWGTYLMAEENFHAYFRGGLVGNPERAAYRRYGIPGNRFAWGEHHRRFDLDREPNAANLFGWVVEVDPLDPQSVPVKRTALGRFKHEGAETVINRDGRLVIYSGDDQRFEYLYRFVTEGRVDTVDRAANRDLLDRGTLSVARFDDDGSVTWLDLVHGSNGLTAGRGFNSQADVVIEARRAADLLGATPLDRPEDVQANPRDGRVYVMLTNNSQRGPDGIVASNPRARNLWGHILELTPPDGDHAAPRARWEILLQAGDPADPATAAVWNPATSGNGWFACPDNCAIDPAGRLWVATDQGGNWPRTSGSADGVWAVQTAGAGRGTGRMFFRAPVGAEVCGPCFTPDGRTLFVAVQHPGSDGTRDYAGFERDSTFDDPATRWPDFSENMPPRPAVVAITREDGGIIGS